MDPRPTLVCKIVRCSVDALECNGLLLSMAYSRAKPCSQCDIILTRVGCIGVANSRRQLLLKVRYEYLFHGKPHIQSHGASPAAWNHIYFDL